MTAEAPAAARVAVVSVAAGGSYALAEGEELAATYADPAGGAVLLVLVRAAPVAGQGPGEVI